MVKRRTLGQRLLEGSMIALTVVLYWVVFYFVIINACKPQVEAAELSLALPRQWYILENFAYVFNYNNYMFLKAFWNSFILTVLSITILVFTSSTTAYILQRRRTRICRMSNKLILAGLIVPASVIPTYWMLTLLGVANTLAGLTLVEVATLFPFATMMYKDYLVSVPREIEEAAMIDGASPLQLFFGIIFPMIKPITVALVILRSVVVYNDFQNPQYYMSGSQSQTVQIFIYMFKSAFSTDYGHLFAAVLLVSLPLIIIFVALNKKIMESMTMGAVKG